MAPSEDADGSGDAVTLDTSSRDAGEQYEASVTFARSYQPRCGSPIGDRKRVLVTGFGRFKSGMTVVDSNASGQIVSSFLPAAPYPDVRSTEISLDKDVSVGRATRELPGYGEVDVCAMILPVSWDLAAVLVAKEIETFSPSFVLMNGVAAARQAIWVELGAVNRVSQRSGADGLQPVAPPRKEDAKVLEEASREELSRGNLLSFQAVQASAREAFSRHAAETDDRVRFDEIVKGGVILAGFPRETGTYVCNNLTYVTGWLMDHPGREVKLMQASTPRGEKPSFVPVTLAGDHHEVPRVFVHWPRDLADRHREASVDVMSSIISAQLRALDTTDAPVRGDNAWADPTVKGGEFY
jgi:hypothetical protein